MEDYYQILESIIKSIVDRPEEVQIEKTSDDMGVLLSVQVSKIDAGKIIGKEGATAKSLRTIIRVIGMKSNVRVSIKILEPKIGY